MEIIDGKSFSKKNLQDLKEEIEVNNYSPRLDIFLIGDNFSSKKYVEMKEKEGKAIGMEVVVHTFADNTPEIEIVREIELLNKYRECNGIMVQLPLPKSFDTDKILNAISVKKDVDGLTAATLGGIFTNTKNVFLPATVSAIYQLLLEYKVEIEGKSIVIIGKSREVGIPLAGLFLCKRATVTVCSSKTKDIQNIANKADILVSSTGVGHLVKKEFVKEGAVVIDVGYSMVDGKVMGDIDFEDVKEKVSLITPVPGGVGPVTVASLLQNTMISFKRQKNV
ncbi:bifunctional 5,10-methylenetetrahydrofolate dehydrogenase/5,10-methenyltetrahydrofolate cyclohydrolase [Candidatus Dojkabacteria bacterium]|jgi:methylenetetrahydrofolate dehydrogenase (NADP+)/methenyltetrahydrofolate cyclohydrolase|nr:bifunctional 5,10-methylenetetrahydrofolate dehydrogenase/5,10-methenyltetrahydrofolate cyclohydrolase [Candidatus Dojkabacteria bacterium]